MTTRDTVFDDAYCNAYCLATLEGSSHEEADEYAKDMAECLVEAYDDMCYDEPEWDSDEPTRAFAKPMTIVSDKCIGDSDSMAPTGWECVIIDTEWHTDADIIAFVGDQAFCCCGGVELIRRFTTPHDIECAVARYCA